MASETARRCGVQLCMNMLFPLGRTWLVKQCRRRIQGKEDLEPANVSEKPTWTHPEVSKERRQTKVLQLVDGIRLTGLTYQKIFGWFSVHQYSHDVRVFNFSYLIPKITSFSWYNPIFGSSQTQDVWWQFSSCLFCLFFGAEFYLPSTPYIFPFLSCPKSWPFVDFLTGFHITFMLEDDTLLR